MIRGYDTSALFREDTILRINYLNAKIAELQKSIEKGKKEAAICEERFQKLKKERGIIDTPKTERGLFTKPSH